MKRLRPLWIYIQQQFFTKQAAHRHGEDAADGEHDPLRVGEVQVLLEEQHAVHLRRKVTRLLSSSFSLSLSPAKRDACPRRTKVRV